MSTRYTIEVVGTNAIKNLGDVSKFKNYVKKVMTAIGPTAVKNIQASIMRQEWKSAPRVLPKAVHYRIGDWYIEIFIDPNIAPFAIYQEEGVRTHEMRYLLRATSSIPLPVGRATVYRWATEKNMGRPHTYIDPKSGLVKMATGWIHPGYPGKYFFRDGIKDTLKEVIERQRYLVLKVARGE